MGMILVTPMYTKVEGLEHLPPVWVAVVVEWKGGTGTRSSLLRDVYLNVFGDHLVATFRTVDEIMGFVDRWMERQGYESR